MLQTFVIAVRFLSLKNYQLLDNERLNLRDFSIFFQIYTYFTHWEFWIFCNFQSLTKVNLHFCDLGQSAPYSYRNDINSSPKACESEYHYDRNT